MTLPHPTRSLMIAIAATSLALGCGGSPTPANNDAGGTGLGGAVGTTGGSSGAAGGAGSGGAAGGAGTGGGDGGISNCSTTSPCPSGQICFTARVAMKDTATCVDNPCAPMALGCDCARAAISLCISGCIVSADAGALFCGAN